MNTTQEIDILKDAVLTFNKITGGKIKQKVFPNQIGQQRSPNQSVPKRSYRLMPDAYIQLTLGNQTSEFLVEIKNEIRQPHLPTIFEQFGRDKEKWLLIAKYIPATQKAHLKAASINYLEIAGNCYINVPGMFIYINDREVTPSRQTDNSKLWSATGLKFLSVILSENSLVYAPYRQIAQAAGIALGNIGPLLEELKQGNYISSIDGSQQLIEKEKLIRRWTELFHVTLRPKLIKGRFRFFDKQQQSNWKSVQTNGFCWGGEAGADLLTNYLEPQTFTIYSSSTTNELIKQLKLIPDAEGNIELLDQFWDVSLLKYLPEGIAPPLIIYAELMAGSDSRTWETADKIKTKYLHDN